MELCSKMRTFLAIFFATVHWPILVTAGRHNISYCDLQLCKEYDSKSGYSYTDYFHIESFRQNVSTADDIVNLQLYVLGSKDAHILLTPDHVNKSAPVYEIVIGAGGNTFSELRRQRQKLQLKSVSMKGFLSAIEITPLTVRVVRNGTISVSVTGQSQPFLAYNDSDTINVQYISFSSWGTNEVKWFFDCASDGGSKLTRIRQKLRTSDQLKSDLFGEYDALITPAAMDYILLDFGPDAVAYDSRRSTLTTKGKFRAKWRDTKLQWKPTDYGNLEAFVLEGVTEESKPWKPTIHVLNGRNEHFIRLPMTYTVSITSTGIVYAESNELELSTWCYSSNAGWPYERVACDVFVQLKQFDRISIRPMRSTEYRFINIQRRINIANDHWQIVSKNVSAVDRGAEGASPDAQQNGDAQNGLLRITVTLTRNSDSVQRLLYTPLYGTFLLLLLSFWLTRYLRLTLILLSLFVLVAVQLVLVDQAPTSHTPSIVYFYSGLIFIACLSLLLFVLSCWLDRYKSLKPFYGFEQYFNGSSVSYDETKFDDDHANDSAIVLDRIAFVILSLVFSAFLCFA